MPPSKFIPLSNPSRSLSLSLCLALCREASSSPPLEHPPCIRHSHSLSLFLSASRAAADGGKRKPEKWAREGFSSKKRSRRRRQAKMGLRDAASATLRRVRMMRTFINRERAAAESDMHTSWVHSAHRSRSCSSTCTPRWSASFLSPLPLPPPLSFCLV